MPRSSDHHVVRANRNRNLAVGRHSLLAFAAHDLRLPASAALMAVELADQRGRLLQVLLNLTGNAIKFASRSGRVDIEAWSEGDEVRVSVADNGPGVADEDLAHLFEQYWQGQHIAAYAGAGLGLTIAKCLIEAQGGRIAAGRAREGGLLVTFAIPIAVQRSAAA
jgi:signal transduction histidine kinase